MVKRPSQPVAVLASAPLATLMWWVAAQTTLDRVEARQYARIFGALILLAIGGVALVVLAWLALRVGRRSSRRADARLHQLQGRFHPDDWVKPPGRGRDQPHNE